MTILAVYISEEADQHYIQVAEDTFIPFSETNHFEVQDSINFIEKNSFSMFAWFSAEDVEADAGPIYLMDDVKNDFLT